MQPIRITLALTLGSLLFDLPARARLSPKSTRPGAAPEKLEAINASYRRQLRKSNGAGSPISRAWRRSQAVRRRTRSTGRCSTWRSRGYLCPEAQAAAGNCLASASSGRDMHPWPRWSAFWPGPKTGSTIWHSTT